MIRKAYVDTARGQIHYRYTTGGGSGAPLVCFHMTAGSSGAYHDLMEELDGSVPVFALDTMNYGESFRTTDTPTIPYISHGLLEAITNIGIDSFHTLGHHTGVNIQCEIATIAPERVASLLMSGPNYATPEENAYLIDKLVKPNPISIKGTQFIAAWSRIKDNYPFSLWADADVQASIMNRDTVDMLRAGEEWCWAYRAVFTHDLPTVMKKTNTPKFFICGGQDLAFPFHQKAASDYPDAATHSHPDGGVYYLESHPKDAAEAIKAFLGSLA